MKQPFGTLPDGMTAFLYTISLGSVRAQVTDYGATLVRLFVPDRNGKLSDVVLGFDDVSGYTCRDGIPGATVGRNANRIKNASFPFGGRTVTLTGNEKGNSLHSGPDIFARRMWQTVNHTETAVTFLLESPDGDQGFPGKASIRVTYELKNPATLSIRYEAISDKDTVFNMTNHSYFNLAGHDCPEQAMEQTLMLPARVFTPSDTQSIPTGEVWSVEGTPMDFRIPKPLGQDIDADYAQLRQEGGYNHNFEVFCSPCAILCHPASGRTMAVSTDCPGIQIYTGDYLAMEGKDGAYYGSRSGVALETQFYPNSVNQPEWRQPFVKANTPYRSETVFQFNTI